MVQSHTPSFTHNFVTHTYIHYITYIHTYIRTYVHTYIRTYVHTYMHTIFSHTFFLCHTPSFTFHFVTHTHTTVLTSRSFTTSFVFPSFPVPATTFEAHYWKKLTCGVIRSFNFPCDCPGNIILQHSTPEEKSLLLLPLVCSRNMFSMLQHFQHTVLTNAFPCSSSAHSAFPCWYPWIELLLWCWFKMPPWQPLPECGPFLVMKEYQDVWYLKVRPSHHKITQLLTEGNPKKNASLTNSGLLQELKTKRDDALTKSLMPTPHEEGLGNENAKKQKPAKQTMDIVVQIGVDGTMVHCLCPKSRGTSNELMVEMDMDQLTAVFQHLQPDTQKITLQSPKKTKKRKRDQVPPEGHGAAPEG